MFKIDDLHDPYVLMANGWGHEGPNVHELFTELPRLADVLLAGLDAAVVRGDIFVNRSRLERARGGVARAKTVWLRPDPSAGEIVGLRNALTAAGTGEPVQPQRRPARAAFPRPPQPGTAATRTGHPLAVTSTAPRKLSRS